MIHTPHHRFFQKPSLLTAALQTTASAWGSDGATAALVRGPLDHSFRRNVWRATEDSANTAHAFNSGVASATITAAQHRVRIYVRQIPGQAAVRHLQFFLFDWNGFPANYALGIFNLLTGVASPVTQAGTVTSATATMRRWRGWWQIDLLFTMPAATQYLLSFQMTDATQTTPYVGDGASGMYFAQPFFGVA